MEPAPESALGDINSCTLRAAMQAANVHLSRFTAEDTGHQGLPVVPDF